MVGKLRVGDSQIAIAIEHYDVALHMLATYRWSALVTNEHCDNSLSLVEFYALLEAIRVMKHNYCCWGCGNIYPRY